MSDHKFKVGDVVTVTEEGYASGKVGIIGDGRLELTENYRVTFRVPVMFPKFAAARWFLYSDVWLASDYQRKRHFLELLKSGR